MTEQNNTKNTTIEDELEEYLSTQEETSIENRPSVLDGDLLSKIAAEDVENEKKEKQKKVKKQISFSKVFQITLMRCTLFLDRSKHKYASVFRTLGIIWSLFISLIYAGGICSAVVLVSVYMNYPNYVKKYFQENGIQATYDLDSYSFSKIILKNIKDKDKAYSIQKVTISSSFSDFLRKKIKSVVLDNVVIEAKEKKDKLEVGHLAKLLIQLNKSSQRGYHIGSISISKAVMNIKGEKYTLPIQFSMNGFYENNTSVSIPLSIKQDYMNISGMLSLSGNAQSLDWSLDIMSGNLSFPNKQPENVTGKFKIQTNGMSVSSINGNLNLTYGKNLKDIKIDLKKSKKLFKGTVSLSLINKEVKNELDETKTEMNMVFDGLDIKHLSSIESSQPIRFNVQSFYMQDINLSNASGILRGNLSCQNFNCSYQVTSNVPVNIQALKANVFGGNYVSKGRVGFVIKPNKRKNILWDSDIITLDLSLSDLVYNGYKNITTAEIKTNAKTATLNGKLGSKANQSQIKLRMSNLNYETNDTKFKNANLLVSDLYKENRDLTFTTKEILLKNNQLMKMPFALSFARTNNVVTAEASLLNNAVHSQFQGVANLLSGTFQGAFLVKPVNLNRLPKDLTSVTTLIPEYIKNLSGKASLYGNIVWKNEKEIAGPFYLSLENTSFSTAGQQVENLNTILLVQSLAPFVTASNQPIYIGKIDTAIPLQNVVSLLKFDNQMLRLTTATAQIAGTTVSAENVLMPYRANSSVMYLKNQSVNLTDTQSYLNIPNLTINGLASVTLPIELKNGQFELNSGEIKFNNVDLKYTGKDAKIKQALFKKGNEFTIKSGNIVLTPNENGTVDVYLNFDGREQDQTKMLYKDSVSLNPAEIIIPTSISLIPTSISEKQKQLNQIISK